MREPPSGAKPQLAVQDGLRQDICVNMPFHQGPSLAALDQLHGSSGRRRLVRCRHNQNIVMNPTDKCRFTVDRIGIAYENWINQAKF